MKLQTLELDKNELEECADAATEEIGFWKRQFLQTPTKKQIRFDWMYGVVVPLGCVAADPIVFTRSGMLGKYQAFAYALSSVSILTMAAWLLWGERLRWLAAPIGGLFIAGSLISFLVGVILIPFSLLGLIIVIGILGFTPLLAGLVYLRNGVRAVRASGSFLDKTTVWHAAALAAILALVIPYVINGPVSLTNSLVGRFFS